MSLQLISCSILFILFKPIFLANEVIIDFGLNPYDICQDNPLLWNLIKKVYVITYIYCNLIVNSILYKYCKIVVSKKNKENNKRKFINKSDIKLLIGYDKVTKSNVYIPEQGLYQNILITGTIGTGKTSSAMYPFTRQLIKYNSCNKTNKIGMLILDVKGNYYRQVRKYTTKFDLNDDLIVLELNSNIKYNPLHKPRIKGTSISK